MSDRSITDWPLIAALFTAGLLAAAQFAKVALVLPQVADHFDRPVAAVAYLVSMLGIIGILGGVLAGGVVAALGARRVILGSLVLGAGVSACEAFLPPLPVFSLLRVVEGASHLGIVVAAPPLMAGAASDRDRPVVMAIWAAFFGLSFTLSALIVPSVLGAGGLPLLLGLHGAGLLAIAVPLARRLERQTRTPMTLDPVSLHRRIYSTPRLAAPGAGFMFYTLVFVAFVTLLPVATGKAWLAVALPLCGLAGTFLSGPLLTRVTPDQVAAAAFGAVLAGALALLVAPVLLVLPVFVVMGLIPGASFAMIPHLNGSTADRARASGCIAQLGNVGTVLGTPLFALCLAAGGTPFLFGACAASAACGLAVVLGMRRIVRASDRIMS
ncbi:MFS transporter [Maribius pontilimi]|uniref:MFS transporter n=1 Tax=Palleronia pontilimi TaxID=1964209 RepID=A0A934I7T9_9RHOB|nr:MFS transporter [Palleronia pontilimi]MBJ3761843.1 MFS transporter [Palleronia pontilimi]